MNDRTDGKRNVPAPVTAHSFLRRAFDRGTKGTYAAGVLVDAAAAIMATVPRLRNPTDMRETCEEFRKRLKGAIRAHQAMLDARARNPPDAAQMAPQGTVIRH